jgi:hypothetical protein
MPDDLNSQSEQHTPPSFEESLRKRMEGFLQRGYFDSSLGTVWWMSDAIAKVKMSAFREPKNRTGDGHYYVSTHSQPRYDFVPLLFGTSGNMGPVVAQGITEKHGRNYATSFGQIIQPAILSAKEIVYKAAVPNNYKPRFNDAEISALKNWMSLQNQRRK